MDIYHPKYKIKKGDTIASVTERFGVDSAQWMRYHNNCCRLDDVIYDKIPPHLKEIYLLPELADREYELNAMPSAIELEAKKALSPKVRFGIHNSIFIYKLPARRVYRASINYPESKTSIDYEIVAKGIKKTSGAVIMSFEKQNFFINKFEPDLVMDEVAVIATKGLYPIELSIDYINGNQEILNLEAIKKSWVEAKKSISREYTGEIIDDYFAQTESYLTDGNKFTQKLVSGDIFFTLFTHSVYQSYTDTLTCNTEIRMPLGRYNEAMTFKGEQRIEPLYNHMNGVFVHFKGYAEDMDTYDNTPIEYELDIEYNLQYETFSIKDIVAEINRTKKGGAKIPIMQASIYQLRKEEALGEEVLDEEKIKEKTDKKSWFSKFFE